MKNCRNAAIALLVSLYSTAGIAVAQDAELTPSETIALLEKIDAMSGEVGETRFGVHSSAITAFRDASSSTTSAYDFYLKCYKEVHFERRDARESEYRDWKSKNVQYLRSKEHSEARRLQLGFLVLTLRAAQLKKPEEVEMLVPELTSLVDNAIARYGQMGGQSRRVLQENATSSVFAQVYELSSTLKGLKNWPSSPLDIDGLYENTVLPLYRSVARAGDLAGAWEKRIDQRTRLVAALENPEAEKKFSETSLPRLRWKKNMDLLRAGKSRTALTEMTGLAGRNLDHPDIDSWLAMLRGYLNGDREPETYGVDEEEELE